MNIKDLQGPYKHVFMTGEEVSKALVVMEKDQSLNTSPSYVRNGLTSIRLISFRERHASYLREHPKINPEHYLSNLRTMIKIRP